MKRIADYALHELLTAMNFSRKYDGIVMAVVVFLGLALSVLAEGPTVSTEEKIPPFSLANPVDATNGPITVINLDKWPSPHMFVMAEHRKNLYGGGLRIEGPILGSEEYLGRMYVGMDIASLRQSDLNENTILSFVIVGIQGPWLVSPYVEGGFNTADVVLIILGDSQDSRWGSSYASAGIAARLSRNVSTRVYYKTYFLDNKFGENAEYSLWGCAVGISF